MDWTDGYVTELGYTHGYYRELSPGMLRLACLSQGVAPPELDGLRYLELGFGQGLSLAMHAAAGDGTFWGTDLNPSHASQARAWARAAGADLTVLDDGFTELVTRQDLPEFDIIALHGVWSWISPENRRAVVQLCRKHLRVGGLLYLSYNTTPGWSATMPVRHLMTLHAELATATARGLPGRIDEAIAFASRVADAGAGYFRANPSAAERLKGLSTLDRHYLAHEYFNRDWHPMAFSEVADALAEAKLSHVASAHVLDHLDAINLTADGQRLLAEITHPVLRQSVRDYLVNQYFRRDVFVKGPRRLTPTELERAWRDAAFVLTTHPADVPMTVAGALGQANLLESLYRPLVSALAEDGAGPKTLGQLLAHPSLPGTSMSQLREAALLLTGGGHLFPVQPVSAAAQARCQALNAHLLERALTQSDVSFLVSPVTGAGVMVPRIPQLFLNGTRAGRGADAQGLAAHAWEVLQRQGQRLVQEGKPLEAAEENLAELARQAEAFLTRRLPTLQALAIA
ncbi:MAG: class I SAM-dependent methyltransferase [Candidatus Sericytochromatia bacterium]|nr:class I SAM-dependent methyltransferase [Candidatus Sericytochromatia bacterium]